MSRRISVLFVVAIVGLVCIRDDALGRGFGGGGGFHGGGSFGGGNFGGDRSFGGGNFGGDRSFGGGDFGGDRNFGGGDFSADRFGGYGGDRYGNIDGDRAAAGNVADRGWQSAYAGSRFAGDGSLARYSNINGAGINHVTANWSQGDLANRAGNIRSNFGYYNCFHPNWYAAHPGCWFAAGWAAGDAWRWATWPAVTAWCGIAGAPAYYDYGNNIVYQDDDVYYDGRDVCTAQQYAQLATNLADQGQQANPPTTDDWQPLGVFALVQGNETTSNNLFQLAVDKQGTIRGNYYDGLMDTTTPVYGSVDKKNQRAAWTIGKSNERVFDTGIYNLTKPQAPVLVHFGADRTQQWLLVRVEQPNNSQSRLNPPAPESSTLR
ncbi:MAG TPA: hypothetical protein VMJ32_19060 [Pirellulales bacterium]|nr:hypothetical protein [Pirellulales bacterium]